MIEKVSENQSENLKEFFLPHRPVLRLNTEPTKLRVVYNTSAKSEPGYSLNDFLEKGPSLQNKLWDILIRTRYIGLNQSPFILEGTLKSHFERYESMYLELLRKIRDDMYFDDLVTGEQSFQEAEKINSDPIELFEKRGFKLNKWHSNEPYLETNNLSFQKELNFAKEHLGAKVNETKKLGMNWDKQRDTFRVEIPTESQNLTKKMYSKP